MKNRRDNRKNEIKQTAKFVTTIIVATLLIMAMPTPAGAKVVDATPTVIQPIDDYVQDMIGELSGGLMIGDRITVDLGLIFEDSEDLEYTVFTYNNSVAAVTIQSGDLLIDANSAGSTRVELIVRTSEQGIPIYEQFLLSVDSIEDMDGDGIGIDDIIKYNFERPDRLNATFLEKALDQIDTIESPANTAPTTHPAPYHINVHAEDQVTLDMSSFFSDPDGDELDYEFIDVPTSGSYIGVGLQDGELTVDGSTSVTMVTVSASDGEDGHFVTKQFYISIFNRAPSSITLTGTKTVAENSEPNLVVGELTAMDLDAGDNHTFSLTDNDNNSFSIVNNSLRAATSFNYEVKDTYSIVIRATDQDGLFVEQPFTISVMNGNDAPKAVEDVYATDEDTLLSGNVLSNDTDEDGDSLTVIKGSSPTKGTLALQVDGTFTYMPDPDSNGVDNFTYKLYDGITYSEPATVMIQVNSVNDAPIAQDNTYTVNEDELLEVKVVNGHALFDNDYDPEGGPIFAELVADVTKGVLTLSPNGEFNYKPNAGFTGPDYFTYRVRDNDLTYSNYAYVTITVLPVNHAPYVANEMADYSVTEDLSFSFEVPSDTFEDIDADDTLSYEASLVDGAPLPGWLIFDAASRTFSGTPENIHVGSLTVRVTALDKAGASMKNDFMITVMNVNDAPVVLNSIDDQTVIEGNFFSIEIPSIFSDIDGDTLSYEVIRLNFPSLPTWLTYNADTRMLSGTPTSITEFTVRVTANDGNGGSVFEDFKLSVVPLNYRARLDNPIADQTVTVDVLYSFEVPANTFSDQDGDPLTYVAKKPNGTLLPDWLDFDPDTRTFSGTPSTSDMGTFTVSLRASDGSGEWAVDEFNITVTGN